MPDPAIAGRPGALPADGLGSTPDRSGSGVPLPLSARSFFEPRFGHDFSSVRVHAGEPAASAARSIGALAYTYGSDIVFGDSCYQPGADSGMRLLAHELTHVVQQQARPRIQRRVVDDDAHMTCRPTRPGAFETIQAAETSAISIARRVALMINLRLAFHPLVEIVGETPQLAHFRDVLWRRFHLDYNDATVRNTWLPILARRFELVADWIGRIPHRYGCGAAGTEPPGSCTTHPGAGIAWSATAGGFTDLCELFWGESADDQAGTVLHEWFHEGFDFLGDCESRNLGNAVCYDTFGRELVGTATPAFYQACCPPPVGPLPPLAGVPTP